MRQENSTLLISNSKSTIHWKTTAYPLRIKWSTKITAAFLYRGTSCFQPTRKFEDYNLQFEIDERLEYNLLQNDLISNQTNVLAVVNNVVPLKYELFENDALIFKSLQSKYLTILKNQTPLLRVHYWISTFGNLDEN
jgi:hypothetical protein